MKKLLKSFNSYVAFNFALIATMNVMSKTTGMQLTGFASFQQRLADALVTRRGSLVGLRDYGSDIHLLLDKKHTASFTMKLFATVTSAINRPVNGLLDFKLQRLRLNVGEDNTSIVTIIGNWLGESVELEFGV